jgi:hypothetical protein
VSDDDENNVQWLNVKSDFTSFGPASAPSALEGDFPELFERVRDDETAVTYSPASRRFGIPVLDGGGSTITIAFDPWTGRKLPDSLHDRLCDELEALGLEYFSDEKPEAFKSETWWLERGL